MTGAIMEEKSKSGHRQRLRDRFIQGDELSYTEEALLELLLTFAIPQQDVMPLAQRLLAHFGSLSEVLAADLTLLGKIEGLKTNSAILLKLVDRFRRHNTIGPEEVVPDESNYNNEQQHDTVEQEEVITTEVIPTERNHNNGRQLKLFLPTAEEASKASAPSKTPDKKITTNGVNPTRRGTGLFSNDLVKEAIEILPKLPETASASELKTFLMQNLPFSAETTRERYGQYIVLRMFQKGYPDAALQTFAKFYAGRQELREVCFYRFCRAEPLMFRIIQEVLLPQIGSGYVERARLNYYLAYHFPESKNIAKSAQAVIAALTASEIVRPEKQTLHFAYREVTLPAFAFLLYSEFQEPGIYELEKLEQNQALRAMLWNPDRILPALYELRNQGLISKVSEIDRVRQFSTNFTLEEVVRQLVQPK